MCGLYFYLFYWLITNDYFLLLLFVFCSNPSYFFFQLFPQDNLDKLLFQIRSNLKIYSLQLLSSAYLC
jgi:hypothetical protein